MADPKDPGTTAPPANKNQAQTDRLAQPARRQPNRAAHAQHHPPARLRRQRRALRPRASRSEILRRMHLAECFPAAKSIFSTAKKRRAAVFKRMPRSQWFDNFSLMDPLQRQHLQYDGIEETSGFVTGLVEREAEVVGVGSVVIGGLSQGCAAALHVLLNFGGKRVLAGSVGMSGWLPFAGTLDPRSKMQRRLSDEEDENNDAGEEECDVFDPDGDEQGETDREVGEALGKRDASQIKL